MSLFNNGKWAFDYNDDEVVKRQSMSPNASCDVDGVFYDVQNCAHEINKLRDACKAWEQLFIKQCYINGELKEESFKIRKGVVAIANSLGHEQISKTVDDFIMKLRQDFRNVLLKKED